jgi:AcrR family transcriptional regulator
MPAARSRDQARSPARTRIVRAAAKLLREGGVAGVTTRAVAEAAGVQPPAIYRLFGDKDGLIDAVAESEAARYVGEKSAAAESEDPLADLRAAWERNVAFGLANPALFVLLTDPARVARSPVAAAGLEVLRSRVRRLAAAGLLKVPEERAVELIGAAGIGAVYTLLAGEPAERDPGLAVAIFDAVMGTVLAGAPGATAAEDSTLAAAVTLRAALPESALFSPGERALLDELLARIGPT